MGSDLKVGLLAVAIQAAMQSIILAVYSGELGKIRLGHFHAMITLV